jgi:hypothetical protein
LPILILQQIVVLSSPAVFRFWGCQAPAFHAPDTLVDKPDPQRAAMVLYSSWVFHNDSSLVDGQSI